MKRLGTVLHLLGHKGLIVRGESDDKMPKLESVVVMNNMKRIGRIYDVFGPVRHPYISIRLYDGISMSDACALKGQRVYSL
ncbi:MAG: Gar1/Naf1 family protein [Methanosarcinales archaeon Met12]|nr:MAG: Gar1/Naf1 family protein [Methanosarcinales archaeon Met12]